MCKIENATGGAKLHHPPTPHPRDRVKNQVEVPKKGLSQKTSEKPQKRGMI